MTRFYCPFAEFLSILTPVEVTDEMRIDLDPAARQRLRELAAPPYAVPVLVAPVSSQ